MSKLALIPNKIILTRFSNKKVKLSKLTINYLVAISSYISPEDKVDEGKDYKIYRIAKAELKAKFGFNDNTFYRDLWTACEQIASFVFNVSDNPKKNLETNNIQIKNMKQDSYIEVKIYDTLLNLFTNIQPGCDGFTTVEVDRFLSFDNEYTKKMYLVLCDKLIPFDVPVYYSEEEIRDILDLTHKYSNFSDVLWYGFKVAQTEMMGATDPDLYFTYEPKKEIRGKMVGAWVTKKSGQNILRVVRDGEKSYNKHNVYLDESKRAQFVGLCRGVLRLSDKQAGYLLDHVPYVQLIEVCKRIEASFKASENKTGAFIMPYKYAGYAAKVLREAFGDDVLNKERKEATKAA